MRATRGQEATCSPIIQRAGRFVLLVMVCLVLVIVCATGRWLLFSGGQKPSPRNSVLTMLANAQSTTTVTSTQNSSLSPALPPSPCGCPETMVGEMGGIL
jgi:hypothetical protein